MPSPRSLVLAALVALLATLGLAVAPSAPAAEGDGGPFTEVTAFATKTGFRAVVAWSATNRVSGVVRFGTDPSNLDRVAPAPGGPDTAQLVILDGLETGATYTYVVEDLLSGATTPPQTFEATNAYTDFDETTGVYTLDLLVQLDSQSLPQGTAGLLALEDLAAGINVFAERVNDALDGHARVGNVLITDTLIDHAGTVPGVLLVHSPGTCETPTNLADVIVTTAMPFDSHTFGWGVDEPCMPFFVGRAGQLVVPWEDDLHFGYVATHEMMHYAFGAPDLYPGSPNGALAGADCINPAWDGSLMYNTGGWAGDRWSLTELDRGIELTPCTMGTAVNSWDTLRARYTEVPAGAAPEHVFDTLPRGNADGGALDIRILNREPGGSTLARYTPDDSAGSAPACADGATSTSFTDVAGDATRVVLETGVPAANEPALDVVAAGATALAGGGVRLSVEVDDLAALPPRGANGEHFDVGVVTGTASYLAVATWDRLTGPSFELQRIVTTRETVAPLTGTFDVTSDTITIDIPASIGPDFAAGSTVGGFEVTSRRLTGVVVPDADDASGGCRITV